jgi:tetratricopeptide (TPR) repeat protein
MSYAWEGDHRKALSDLYHSLLLYSEAGGKGSGNKLIDGNLLKLNRSSANMYNILGVKFMQIGLIEYAVDLFKLAIRLDPANVRYYSNLCSAYGNLSKYREAITIGEQAIKLDPSSGICHYNLSVAYYFDNKFDLASKHLEAAVNLGFKPNPEYVQKLEDKRKALKSN